MGNKYRHRYHRVAKKQKIIHADVKAQERVSAAEVLVAKYDKHEYGDKNRAPCQRAGVPVEHEQVGRQTSEPKLQYKRKERRLGVVRPVYPEPSRGARPHVEENNKRAGNKQIRQQKDVIKDAVRPIGRPQIKSKAEQQRAYSEVVLILLPKQKCLTPYLHRVIVLFYTNESGIGNFLQSALTSVCSFASLLSVCARFLKPAR